MPTCRAGSTGRSRSVSHQAGAHVVLGEVRRDLEPTRSNSKMESR